jgi:hypothetical protein
LIMQQGTARLGDVTGRHLSSALGWLLIGVR